METNKKTVGLIKRLALVTGLVCLGATSSVMAQTWGTTTVPTNTTGNASIGSAVSSNTRLRVYSNNSTGLTQGLYLYNSYSLSSSVYGGNFYTRNTGTGTSYSLKLRNASTGTGNKYGIHSMVTGTSGKRYGIYAYASGTTDSWAGYFVGTGYFSKNLGIGTKTPTNKLHIAANNQGGFLLEHTATSDYQYASRIQVNREGTKAFAITNGVNDLFLIHGNGVVNTKKLYAEEIEVRVDAIGLAWPDYVFGKNYKLKTLEEVESYVKKNKHLENVPSEKEVNAEGINIAKMNAALLRKVEELTLYLIEQNKQLKAQQEELEELKTQLVPTKN